MKMLTTAKSGKLRNGVVAALVLGLLFTAVPADAQQGRSEIRDLKKQIVRIEKQLRAVQRRVFGKNFPTVEELEAAETGAGTQTQSSAELLANMEVRLGGLDRQMRQLTGKIEEMEFQQSRLISDLGKLLEDINFRFRELEQRRRPQPKSRPRSRCPEALLL